VTASSEVTLEECERIYKPLGVESLFFDLAQPDLQSAKLQTLLETEIEAVVFNAAPETRMLKRLHEFSLEEVSSAMHINISGNFWILKKS
jgi:short-subunit dehydrogenase